MGHSGDVAVWGAGRKRMKNTMVSLTVLIVCLMFLTGCIAGPNPAVDTTNEDGTVAGFWLGLWHGFIAAITWFISLFSSKVHFYEVHNNGGSYNFGFILGIGALCGGGSRASRRRRKR